MPKSPYFKHGSESALLFKHFFGLGCNGPVCLLNFFLNKKKKIQLTLLWSICLNDWRWDSWGNHYHNDSTRSQRSNIGLADLVKTENGLTGFWEKFGILYFIAICCNFSCIFWENCVPGKMQFGECFLLLSYLSPDLVVIRIQIHKSTFHQVNLETNTGKFEFLQCKVIYLQNAL